ncbi:MAG: flagellar protein FliT [Burkholderiaceae bacterium]
MLDADLIVDHYRAIVAAGEQMLLRAQAGRWDDVAQIASRIRSLGEQVEDRARSVRLEGVLSLERETLLRRMVAIDAEVRHLRQPWAARLDGLLGARPRAGRAH